VFDLQCFPQARQLTVASLGEQWHLGTPLLPSVADSSKLELRSSQRLAPMALTPYGRHGAGKMRSCG